jgi:hypothetical protein
VITWGIDPDVPRSPSEREVRNVPKVTEGKSNYGPEKLKSLQE